MSYRYCGRAFNFVTTCFRPRRNAPGAPACRKDDPLRRLSKGSTHHRRARFARFLYTESTASCLILATSAGIPNGRVDSTLTSLLDILPTLVDVAGAAPPSYADGYSLLPLVGASSHDRRRRPGHVAAMAACDSLNAGQFMLRQDNWKLIVYATGNNEKVFPPQLFDLKVDIWEMHNVAAQNPRCVNGFARDSRSMMMLLLSISAALSQRWTLHSAA